MFVQQMLHCPGAVLSDCVLDPPAWVLFLCFRGGGSSEPVAGSKGFLRAAAVPAGCSHLHRIRRAVPPAAPGLGKLRSGEVEAFLESTMSDPSANSVRCSLEKNASRL